MAPVTCLWALGAQMVVQGKRIDPGAPGEDSGASWNRLLGALGRA